MKIQKTALLIALVSGSIFADNNINLNKMTLFLQDAELQGQAKVSLKQAKAFLSQDWLKILWIFIQVKIKTFQFYAIEIIVKR